MTPDDERKMREALREMDRRSMFWMGCVVCGILLSAAILWAAMFV